MWNSYNSGTQLGEGNFRVVNSDRNSNLTGQHKGLNKTAQTSLNGIIRKGGSDVL